MRIAAHNGARIWGGAERATVMLLRGLSDRGHEVLLLCNDDLVRKEAVTRGVNAELCPIGGDIAVHHGFRLAGVLSRFKPDAFIIGTWKKLFHAGLGARLAKVPRVVARVGLESDVARSAKYRFALLHWIDAVAVNAERMVEPFARLDGFGERKVTVIHNGVRPPSANSDSEPIRRQLGIDSGAFVVGTVARLARQKRLDRLLNALTQTDSSVHCVIAGEGNERASLALLAARSGLERTGAFPRTSGEYARGSRRTRCIRHHVRSRRTVQLDARSDVGWPSGHQHSGKWCSRCSDGDHPAGIVTGFEASDIARAIEDLRADSATRTEMGAAARRAAETKFSFDGMLDRWEEFLTSGAPR